MLHLIKGGHFLGMFNCPPPMTYGPWMKLILAVLLAWEGQIFWEIPAGRAGLHWHAKMVCSKRPLWKAQVPLSSLCFQLLWTLVTPRTPQCRTQMNVLGVYGSLLAQGGTAEPQPLASSPPYLTANVKMPWCKLVLVFQWILKQSLFICVRNSLKSSLLAVPNPLPELGSAHSSEHFVVDPGQGCHPSRWYCKGCFCVGMWATPKLGMDSPQLRGRMGTQGHNLVKNPSPQVFEKTSLGMCTQKHMELFC